MANCASGLNKYGLVSLDILTMGSFDKEKKSRATPLFKSNSMTSIVNIGNEVSKRIPYLMIWVNTTFQTHFGTGKSFQQQLIIEQEINEFEDVPRAQSPGLYAVSIDVVKLSNVRVTDYLLIQPPRKQLKDVSINESKVHQQGNNVNDIRIFANYAQLNFQMSNPNGKNDTCTSIMVKVVPILKQFQVFIQSVLDSDTSSHFNGVTTPGQMCLHYFRLDHLEMHISSIWYV
ncbi:hypothetical protein RFI_03693 [Reticulomyxa filosa]|uniref:Uncharacterized protein n=1 Tax=Reticulomyxa filosa TaxID=46433 RepID=X6P5R0_RETFI|nr:hypothetical protein RFI_03693 [Reticulomyxa filosa]|eukprot:ETO33414.1 hypothetical protein RFI_03693 [Reticulomyxa filosa]